MIGAVMSAKGLAALNSNAQQALLRAQGRVTEDLQERVLTMFVDLLQVTPQWSGNLVSNWQIVVGGQTRAQAYQELPNKSIAWGRIGVHKMGDQEAVDYTLSRELPRINTIRWNSKLAFVNVAPYAEEVQRGQGPDGRAIRDVNKDAVGSVMMATYIATKYNKADLQVVAP